jgi:hypothetical protein
MIKFDYKLTTGYRWLQINYKLTDYKLIDNHKLTANDYKLVDYKLTASNYKWPQAGWVQINYMLATMTTNINTSWNWLHIEMIDWAHQLSFN